MTFDDIVSVLIEMGVTPKLLDNDLNDYDFNHGPPKPGETWTERNARIRAVIDKFREEVKARVGAFESVPSGDKGGEDSGSRYRRVYHFVNHDVYVAVNGYYQSYDGTEYDDEFSEVRPVQKTFTVYE